MQAQERITHPCSLLLGVEKNSFGLTLNGAVNAALSRLPLSTRRNQCHTRLISRYPTYPVSGLFSLGPNLMFGQD